MTRLTRLSDLVLVTDRAVTELEAHAELHRLLCEALELELAELRRAAQPSQYRHAQLNLLRAHDRLARILGEYGTW